MKTENEIRLILERVKLRIDQLGEEARALPFGSEEFEIKDREYAKAIAQHNILLEVLR